MNKLFLTGRFTRDPEVRTTGETSVARFALAVDRKFKREGEPDADFFNCTAFGKTADFVEKYFKKGMKANICGRVQNDNYTDKNGNKCYSVQIMVEEIEFGESKNASGNTEAYTAAPKASTAPGGFMNIPDDVSDEGLPFN